MDQETTSPTPEDLVPEGGVLTAFVLIVEWFDENGDPWVSTLTNPDLSQTTFLGLLERAKVYEEYDEE